MSQNNFYSHILIIKVWDTILECATDYGNIENIVKERFLEYQFEEEGVKLLWKKIELSTLDKEFGLGNIVIESPFDLDYTLFNSVSKIIKYIENDLHRSGRMHKNNKIVFKIIKPLIHNNPFL